MKQHFLWWRDGIIYQIYPRSFADSNGDGIGDLQGIIGRLEYLSELGIDAIWLSPIYPSPDVDFGYDVAHYTDVDPKFGTLEDFQQLVDESRRHNIRIILDLVLNHTSDQHPWFLESRKSKDNPYHDWYLWKDSKPGGGPPNNWQAVFGGSGWQYDPHLDQYYYHMFYKEQPDLNWRNPDVRAALLNVFRFWLDRGVSGFRLDVFNNYFKDPLFRDNPPRLGIRGFDRQKHIYDTSQPEMYPLLEEIRRLLDQYPESYVVGETFLADPQQTASYIGPNLLHAAFNFDFSETRWNPRRFLKAVQRWYAALGETDWPNNFLSNHDCPRTATRYAIGEDDRRLKVAAAMLLTLKGTPYIYYGEEIGLRDIPVKRKADVQDPIGKRFWPFHKGRDGCRAPMQWNANPFAGFSRVKPWLPVHTNYVTRNVVNQKADPQSLLSFFKAIIALRKTHPALQRGEFAAAPQQEKQVLAYTRTTKDEQILIALNFSRHTTSVALPPGEWQSLFSPNDAPGESRSLAPYDIDLLIRDYTSP